MYLHIRGEEKEVVTVSSEDMRTVFDTENLLSIFVDNKIQALGSIEFKNQDRIL